MNGLDDLTVKWRALLNAILEDPDVAPLAGDYVRSIYDEATSLDIMGVLADQVLADVIMAHGISHSGEINRIGKRAEHYIDKVNELRL